MFTPTSKQIKAVSSLEAFIWVLEERVLFNSQDEFQKYFDLLIKQKNKKVKLLDKINKKEITFDEINWKKKDKIKKYYKDIDNLKQYWLNYIYKYFPTKNKLKEKLYQKVEDLDIALKVFDELTKYIDEEKMIEEVIKNHTFLWKNIDYIKQKLFLKKFDKDLISKHIILLQSWPSLLNKDKVLKEILSLKQKNKSINYIKQKLIKREKDREFVENILEEINFLDEKQEIKNQIEIFRNKNLDDKKIINKLLLKWFNYRDIRECL